jgi:hypothetical protein
LVTLLAIAGLLALAPAAKADLFASPINVPAGASALGLATGDFNHDGDRDIVVGNVGDAHLLTAGHGPSFGPPAPLALAASGTGVAVAEFNADGDQDLAFATLTGVRTLVRDDAGAFGAPEQPLEGITRGVAAGDFNHDGDPDLVALVETHPFLGHAQPLLGGAGATFTLLPSTGLPNGPRSVAVADVDQDGHQDAIV